MSDLELDTPDGNDDHPAVQKFLNRKEKPAMTEQAVARNERVARVLDGLSAAIRDDECPIQFSPLLMEARKLLSGELAAVPQSLVGVQRPEDVARAIAKYHEREDTAPADYELADAVLALLHTGLPEADASMLICAVDAAIEALARGSSRAPIAECLKAARAQFLEARKHTGQPQEGALRKLEAQFAEDVADLEAIKARGDLTKDYGEHSLHHARRSLERVRAALSPAPASPRAEGEWSEITEKHRDGHTEWWVYDAHSGIAHQAVWKGPHGVFADGGWYDMPFTGNGHRLARPTHCRPLPAPPAIVAEKREKP